MKVIEPTGITPASKHYSSDLSRAFNWYNQEKDKKDARHYLKYYLGKDKGKVLDQVPDSAIVLTFGWMARMKLNGCEFKPEDVKKFDNYITSLPSFKVEKEPVEEIVAERPSVRDYLEDKAKEYLGDLEGVLDSVIYEKKDFNLLKDMQSRALPAQYCLFVSNWIKRKAGEFIFAYESQDAEIKAAYNHIGRRGIASLISTLNQWLQDVEKYSQFKKANRKPRVKKAKPAGAQVAKLKYLKESTELKIKSISPTEMIGASQVWIYNAKYKKLAVYRSDSRDGIQVKGSSLQNYDPAQSEQKALRKPAETLKRVIEGGKIVLRKLLSDLSTKESTASGRINSDCIIVRAIK